jgi:uncharacterized damage-inducible protein DinB
MTELYKEIVLAQFEAALAMFRQCVERCPAEHWEEKIANGTFRQTAYHTLFFVDFYLSKSDDAFQRRDIHERGGDELQPRVCTGLSQAETLGYVSFCHKKLRAEVSDETEASLAGPSGISFRKCTRADLHLYNLRHVQHHTGAMSAFLRKLGVELDWISRGWR